MAAAYGWEAGLSEEAVLGRLVALNAKRRSEEEQGRARWLRPAYQAPEEMQGALEMETQAAGSEEGADAQPRPWPDELATRVQAVQGVVAASGEVLTPEEVAARFRYARRKQVRSILETLEALSQVRRAGTNGEEVRFAG